MRKGFLAPASRSAQRFAPITPESLLPEDNVLERSDSVSPSDPGRTDPSAETDIGTSSAQYTETTVAAQLPAVSRQSSSAALSSCLDLLKGPSDERRLAGLVIATTRLVGNVGVEELRQIYEAVGFTFVSRLLLPLARSQGQPSASKGEYGLAVNTSALALSLLASFVQIPGFCQEPQLTSRIPLLCKVILAGGIAAVLDPEASGTSEGQKLNLSSLDSALAVAIGITQADEELAVRSGAIRAASRCLTQNAAQHPQVLSAAVQLLSLLLKSRLPDAYAGGNGAALASAVPVLALLLAGPAALPQGGSSVPAPEPSTESLAMQLDALHLLLLILTVPLPQGAEVQAALERQAAARGAWLEAMRDGVHQLLRSKTGPRQRHGALQLAGAMASLAGSSWLLGSSKENAAGSFFQLLVQLLKVELHLSLRDALEPDAPVPSTLHALDTAPTSSPASAAAPEGNGSASTSRAQAEIAEEIGTVAGIRHLQLEDRSDAEAQPEGPTRPGHEPEAGAHMQTAGQRAQQLLPPLLELVEASIDALASDCDAAEALSSGQPVDYATLQILSDREAVAMGSSLHEAADMLLQYLEAKTELDGGLEDDLSLAVTRCLGRFLADAPTAHGERVRKLLPQLLAMHGGRALPFLGPALSQLALPPLQDDDAAELQLWQALLRSRQVLDTLLARVAHMAVQVHTAWQAASSAEGGSERQELARHIAQEADGQLDCICTLAADLLDDRESVKSGDAVHPHATAETMLSALSALCQSSVAPRTPAASMQGEQEEIRAKQVLALLACQLVTLLHKQGCILDQQQIQSASNTILDALQTGDGFKLIHAAHLRMTADQSPGVASASHGSLESLGQQSSGDLEEALSIDHYWTALLQSATLLAGRHSGFATAAAASRYIHQLSRAAASNEESVVDLELRLFCQTVQQNADAAKKGH